jgi:long-chain fatty acid transport protein
MKIAPFLLTVLTPLALCATNGMLQVGYGPKAKGMGGAGIALPQDSLAAAYNPAGNVLVGDRIDVGGEWIGFDGDAQFHAVDSELVSTTNENYVFPEVGLNWMLCEDMSFGLAFYLNGLFDVNYKSGLEGLTDNEDRVRSEYHQYFITPSWSWMINDCHFLGIGVHVAFGRARFVNLENIAEPTVNPKAVSPGEGETGWGGGIRFGYLGHFMDRFSLGVVYQTKIWMAKYKNYSGFLPDRGDLDMPSMVGVGGAVCILPELVVAADLARVFWSDTEFFGNISSSLNPYGSKNGPGLGWEDRFVARLGVAYDLLECFTVRAGYNYGHTPISSSDVQINALTLATLEHHLTLGASLVWGCNEATIAYVHGFRNGKKHQDEESSAWQKISNRQNAVAFSLAHVF